MKKYLLSFLFLGLLPSAGYAQGSWSYAAPTNGAGTSGAENGRAVCSDAQGNVYIVGNFNGNGAATDFDLTTGGTSYSTSNGVDGYIASYDKNGIFRWKTIVSGSAGDFGLPSGNICTNGTFVWFAGTASMTGSPQITGGTGVVTTISSTSAGTAGGVEALVGKLNCSNGSLVWYSAFGGASTADFAEGLCFDPKGDLYVTGSYTGTFTQNSVTAPAPIGGSDFFIAKFSVDGQMKRFLNGGTASGDMGGNGGGLCYVPGATPLIVATGTLGANSATFGIYTGLANTGGLDAFLVEVDTTVTNYTNALVFGGSSTDELLSASYDPFSTGVYVCGYYSGSAITFPGTTALPTPTGQDLMIARYSPSANNFVWSTSATGSGTNNERAWAVAADGQGGIIVGGTFAGAANDITTFGSTSFSNAGLGDAFVAHYTAGGSLVWVIAAASAATEEVRGVASYVQQGPYTRFIYTTGIYAGTVSFGSTTLTNSGGNDFFVARVTDATAPLPVTLLDLTVSNAGNSNVVRWSVATERDFSHYVVERSADGKLFSTLGELKATGAGAYSINDNNPNPGYTYYRLKLVEHDGTFTYSTTVQAFMSIDGQVEMTAMPNPVQNELRVNLLGAESGTVKLVDLSGRILAGRAISNGTATLPTAGLAAGTYYLVFSNGERTKTIKVTKL